MAKKQFPKDETDFGKLESGITNDGHIKAATGEELSQTFLDRLSPGVRHIVNRVLSVIKLILGLCFLALVYTGSFGFLKELKNADPRLQRDFWAGVITFVLIYLFLYEPMPVYQKGQKILAFLFKFFAPLVKFAPYVLPIYTILACAFYPLVSLFWKEPAVLEYFIYFTGLSLAFHLIMTARTLKNRQDDFLKANYIFGFTLVYVLNLILVALLFQLLLDRFSFYRFWVSAFEESQRIWQAVFRQIFIPSP
ncbi:MAG: hypothetical protein N2606_01170 [Candidatus Omnitrophica bacterium]|nr:hypothetical protein [Candidatus Omnitrophota bacterium]